MIQKTKVANKEQGIEVRQQETDINVYESAIFKDVRHHEILNEKAVGT